MKTPIAANSDQKKRPRRSRAGWLGSAAGALGDDRDHEEDLDDDVCDVGESLSEDHRRARNDRGSRDRARFEQRDAEREVDGNTGAPDRAHRTAWVTAVVTVRDLAEDKRPARAAVRV